MIIAPTFRCAMIGEEHHTSVVALRYLSERVKMALQSNQKSSGLRDCDRITSGPLNGVPTDEDREVQAHSITVAFPNVELDGKASRITGSVWEFSSQSDGRDTNKHGHPLADATQTSSFGELRDIFCGLENSQKRRCHLWPSQGPRSQAHSTNSQGCTILSRSPGPIEMLLLLEEGGV